jgi:single-stranded DNA-binding protein
MVDNNKLAETCIEHLHKYSGIRVIGRLKQVEWTDRDEYGGYINRSKIIIIAEYIEFKPEVK